MSNIFKTLYKPFYMLINLRTIYNKMLKAKNLYRLRTIHSKLDTFANFLLVKTALEIIPFSRLHDNWPVSYLTRMAYPTQDVWFLN